MSNHAMENKTKKSQNGKVPTTDSSNALERRANRRKNRGHGDVADWESADSLLIQKLISVVSFQKGTTTFGYTRDGGAYFISYYFGDKSERVYCRPAEGIDLFLTDEIESFD